jgi:HD-GYP domain-containing protein (c-di-GMP phosphodiesterase class II)
MGEIILSHHERMDGGGYPAGRRGVEIPLGSRILAVVDAFFAMTVSRPYREGRPAEAAAAEMRTHAGTQFDERVLATFLEVLQEEGMLAEPAADRDDSRPVAAPEGTRR